MTADSVARVPRERSSEARGTSAAKPIPTTVAAA